MSVAHFTTYLLGRLVQFILEYMWLVTKSNIASNGGGFVNASLIPRTSQLTAKRVSGVASTLYDHRSNQGTLGKLGRRSVVVAFLDSMEALDSLAISPAVSSGMDETVVQCAQHYHHLLWHLHGFWQYLRLQPSRLRVGHRRGRVHKQSCGSICGKDMCYSGARSLFSLMIY